MATNWPLAIAPPWPPAGYQQWEASDLETLEMQLVQAGATSRNPNNTPQERNLFDGVLCKNGHTVLGRLVFINGVTHYFAVCRGSERTFLVPWFPYEN